MNLEHLKKEIEKTEYWDVYILDVQASYFGDEVYVFVENDEESCWKISFKTCYIVEYQTDADWRGDFPVRDKGPGAGYFGQDISVKEYVGNSEFIEASLHLTIMSMTIVCKQITVEKKMMKDISFFWEKNGRYNLKK